MKALSFFTGAGGLDIGLREAGISTIFACESDTHARRTIQVNMPQVPLLDNIFHADAPEIRDMAGLSPSEPVDMVVGGPPCQAFSTAGRRRGFSDERGNVFLHFVNVLIELSPQYFVIENVRGLLSAPWNEPGTETEQLPSTNTPSIPVRSRERAGGGKAFAYILNELRSAGYTVSFNLGLVTFCFLGHYRQCPLGRCASR